MKKTTLILLLSFVILNLNGQMVNWTTSGAGNQWVSVNGEQDVGYSVISNDNSIYLTGLVTGGNVVVQDSLIEGNHFSFIAKYDFDGTLQWLKYLNGWSRSDVAVNSANEVYAVNSTSNYLKYDSDGNLLEEKHLLNEYGATAAALYSVVVDDQDDVLFSGRFYNYSDSVVVEDTVLFNLDQSSIHAFVMKYNSSGEFEWINVTDGGEYARYRDVKIDNDNNVIAIGDFETLTNDSLTVGDVKLTSLGDTIYSPPLRSQDVIVAKYNSNGAFLWAKNFGGMKDDWGNKIAINNDNEIHIVGTFTDYAKIEDFELVSRWGLDIYVVKLSAEGQAQWVNTAGGSHVSSSGVEAGRSIGIDEEGNVLVSGSFLAKATFGEGINAIVVENPQQFTTQTGFFANYKNDGTLQWVEHISGGKSTIRDFFIRESDVLITGNFFPDGSFLDTTFPVTYNATNNFFLASIDLDYDSDITDPDSTLTSFENIDLYNGVSVYPNPTIDKVNVRLKKNWSNTELTIYNVEGRVVLSKKDFGDNSVLDLFGLPKGLYSVKIIINDQLVIKKLIKN